MIEENLIPKIGIITDIRRDTPDVKTFRVVGTDGKKLFEHMPGQCAMVSVPGVGECMFSITSSPTNQEFMEFSIKKCGCVTEVLHAMEVGQQITVRGPYGKNFPVRLLHAKPFLIANFHRRFVFANKRSVAERLAIFKRARHGNFHAYKFVLLGKFHRYFQVDKRLFFIQAVL